MNASDPGFEIAGARGAGSCQAADARSRSDAERDDEARNARRVQNAYRQRNGVARYF